MVEALAYIAFSAGVIAFIVWCERNLKRVPPRARHVSFEAEVERARTRAFLRRVNAKLQQSIEDDA